MTTQIDRHSRFGRICSRLNHGEGSDRTPGPCPNEQSGLTDAEAVSRLFRDDWDDIFLCACCREALAIVGHQRAIELAATPAPVAQRRMVYFVGADVGPIKIGSAGDPHARLSVLQTSHPYALSILALTDGGFDREREYHRRFAEYRLNGEWFERCPAIEAEIANLSHFGTTTH